MKKKILCAYGCGMTATTILKNGKHICSVNWSKCPVNRLKNTAGLIAAYKYGNIIGRKFTEEERLRGSNNFVKNRLLNPFETLGKKLHYKILYAEQDKKCLICKIDSWNSIPVILEIDHIDGDRTNNTKNNLRLLCPNCHSQTSTWRGRNINTGQIKIDDATLLNALRMTPNISAALKLVGLAPKGGNYKRAKKLLEIL